MRWGTLVVGIALAGCPDRTPDEPEGWDGVPCGEVGRCAVDQVCCADAVGPSVCSTVVDCPYDVVSGPRHPQACDGPEDCGDDLCCGVPKRSFDEMGAIALNVYESECSGAECPAGPGFDGSPLGRLCHDVDDCPSGMSCCPCWDMRVCTELACENYSCGSP